MAWPACSLRGGLRPGPRLHQRLRVSLAFRCGYYVPRALAHSCRRVSPHPASCRLPASPALGPCPLSGPARVRRWLPGPLGGAVAKDGPRPLEALGRVGPGWTGPGHAWAPGDWPWGDGAGSPHPEPLGTAGASPTAGGSAPSSLALPLQAPLLPSPEPLACLCVGGPPQRAPSPVPGTATPRKPFASCTCTAAHTLTQLGKRPLGHSGSPRATPAPGPPSYRQVGGAFPCGLGRGEGPWTVLMVPSRQHQGPVPPWPDSSAAWQQGRLHMERAQGGRVLSCGR